MKETHRAEDLELKQAIVALNFKILGLVLGFLFGAMVFLATNWLLIKGGELDPASQVRLPVGPHLELLGQFFIGYSVSFWGSIIGFLYGFAFGTLTGAALSFLYNRIVSFRHKPR